MKFFTIALAALAVALIMPVPAEAQVKRPTYGTGTPVLLSTKHRVKCGGEVYNRGDRAVVISHKVLKTADGTVRRAPNGQALINYRIRPDGCKKPNFVDGIPPHRITRAVDVIMISRAELLAQQRALIAEFLESIGKAK
ncbi:MAG: hypothetical protein AAFR79_11695 [Pseudomonadota bacterium]